MHMPQPTEPAFFDYCHLVAGQRLSPTRLLEQLLQLEYRRVDQVADPGDVAARGGVLDVFPGTFESPLRIEFESSGIASMRSFNPKTLETLDRHTMVVILSRRIHTRRSSVEVPFESCLDLRDGEHLVHLTHGIGRYVGRASIAGTAGGQDAIVLEYLGGDRLYVPMDQLHLVQSYQGLGGRAPALHKLGGQAWERAKVRASVGAWEHAKILLELKRVGFSGCVNPDHIPAIEGDGPLVEQGLAYSVGYLKALLAALATL